MIIRLLYYYNEPLKLNTEAPFGGCHFSEEGTGGVLNKRVDVDQPKGTKESQQDTV